MTKILIIEDDDGIRENILELLEMEGFVGVGAPDGEGGVSTALSQQPDLIICDIAMPGVQEWNELITANRDNRYFQALRFLAKLFARVRLKDLRHLKDDAALPASVDEI